MQVFLQIVAFSLQNDGSGRKARLSITFMEDRWQTAHVGVGYF